MTIRFRDSVQIGYLMVAVSVCLSAIGQLGMRAGMLELKNLPTTAESSWLSVAALEAPLWFIGGGLLAYTASMLVWLAVLLRFPLSQAYPFLGLTYVLVYLGATQWDRLMESATPIRTLGTILILAGIALVTRSGTRANQ